MKVIPSRSILESCSLNRWVGRTARQKRKVFSGALQLSNDPNTDKYRAGQCCMKVLIQSIQNCLYLGNDGKWVSRVEEALEFKSGAEALMFAMQYQITEAQIVLRFNLERLDVKIPLPIGDDTTIESRL